MPNSYEFGYLKLMIRVDIANDQDVLEVDEALLKQAVKRVLQAERIDKATISVAIVDDTTIRPLNAQYLGHDYATDVLSFVLETTPRLEGEIIVSAETAANSAARFGWQPHDELLLYIIHGALHLVGYDDLEREAKEQMRLQEQYYLEQFGLTLRYEDAG